MKLLFVILLSVLIAKSDSKRITVRVLQKPNVKFNANYINISWDLSPFANGNKSEPVETFPKLTVWVLRDLSMLYLSSKVIELKSSNVMQEVRFSLCNPRSISGIFVRPVMERILQSSNVKVGCPYRKGLVVNVASFKFDGIFISPIFASRSERTNTIVVTEGKSATPIFSVVVNYMKIEVDD